MAFIVEISQTALPKQRRFSERWIEGVIKIVLHRLQYAKGSLSIAFVTKPIIHKANRMYRGKDKPTDVLSFLYEPHASRAKNDLYWGEIVIAPAMARRNVSLGGLPYKKEIARLLIHGTLHLAGYNHIKKNDAKVMFDLSDALLKKVKI